MRKADWRMNRMLRSRSTSVETGTPPSQRKPGAYMFAGGTGPPPDSTRGYHPRSAARTRLEPWYEGSPRRLLFAPLISTVEVAPGIRADRSTRTGVRRRHSLPRLRKSPQQAPCPARVHRPVLPDDASPLRDPTPGIDLAYRRAVPAPPARHRRSLLPRRRPSGDPDRTVPDRHTGSDCRPTRALFPRWNSSCRHRTPRLLRPAFRIHFTSERLLESILRLPRTEVQTSRFRRSSRSLNEPRSTRSLGKRVLLFMHEIET